jgi:hypothetical protein
MKLDKKYKPAVHKPWLYFIAGSLWTLVGIMLISISIHWIRNEQLHHVAILLLIGFFSGLIIHHFGFLRVVDKNLGRFSEMEGKPCVFSFMSWRSYLLVAIMITMGMTLRHSGIPHLYLVPIYSGIGLALFFSSIRYFRFLLKIIQKHDD